jgi:hypothetical protein
MRSGGHSHQLLRELKRQLESTSGESLLDEMLRRVPPRSTQ